MNDAALQSSVARRAGIVLVAVIALAAAAGPAAAADPVNTTWRGVAIEGYDPVAYFEDERPVAGSKNITAEWNGATWRFATAAHRDAFVASPESFAPQYGGFCAYAVSEGGTAGIDPDAWTIRDGKLYLNYSAKIQARWLEDVEERIAAADRHWQRLQSER